MFNFECHNHLQIKANHFLLVLFIVIVASSYSTRVTAANPVCTANNETQIVTFGDISVDPNKTAFPYKEEKTGGEVHVECQKKIFGQNIYVYSISGTVGNPSSDGFYHTSLSGVRFKWILTVTGLAEQYMVQGSIRGIGNKKTFGSKFIIAIDNKVQSGTVEDIIIKMARLDENKKYTGEILYEYIIPKFNITARSCEITTPVVNVPMGAVLKSHFKNIGDTAGGRSFEIDVQCKGAPNANITWEPGKANTNGVINADATSSATGIGIQILDDKSNPVEFGNKQDLGTINTSKTLSYMAKYYQTSHPVTAGSVNATATFTIDYK